MDVGKHNAFLAYFRMTARTYFSWEVVHVRLLLSSIISHNAHLRKHGVVKAAWELVTADLNEHGAFHNNDPNFTKLLHRNVHARFLEMEKSFRAKYLSPTANLSGSLKWDEESEIMKRLCFEKDAEKETKEGAKKDEIEREKSFKNSEIGFNLSSPSPIADFTTKNMRGHFDGATW